MSDKLNQDLQSLKIDRSGKTGHNPARQWLAAGGVGVALLSIPAAVWFFYPQISHVAGIGSRAREVQVAVVARQAASADTVVLTAGGYLIPHTRVEVSSKVSGRVEQLFVDKGSKVKSGEVLARLDDREVLAQLAQSRAAAAAARARLNEAIAGSRPQEVQRSRAAVDQAEANLNTARLNLDRARLLNQTGVLAKQAFDDAQNGYDVASAQLRVARENFELARLGPRQEQIELARAQLSEAEASTRWWEAQLDNTIIRAPVGGTVLERLIERGEMVTTGYVSGRGAKSALVSIANLRELEVELDINESDIPRVRLGQACIVSPDSYPQRKYRAHVREIAPEANRQKATIQVKVAVEEPDEYLRPESNAKVNFLAEKQEAQQPRILIPKSAVVGGQVFIAENGKALRRPVRTGQELWGQLEVVSGLSGGEQLIVGGLEGLRDGEKVVVK